MYTCRWMSLNVSVANRHNTPSLRYPLQDVLLGMTLIIWELCRPSSFLMIMWSLWSLKTRKIISRTGTLLRWRYTMLSVKWWARKEVNATGRSRIYRSQILYGRPRVFAACSSRVRLYRTSYQWRHQQWCGYRRCWSMFDAHSWDAAIETHTHISL